MAFLVFCGVLFAALPSVYSREIIKTETLFIGPERVACGITYPAPEANKKLGLLLWFHGGMNSTRKDKGIEAHMPLLSFVDSGAYVLASPSAYRERNWLSAEAMVTTAALVDSLCTRFSIDLNKFHLIGVSDGTLAVILYSQFSRHPMQNRMLFSTYPELVLSKEHLSKPPAGFTQGRWVFFQGGKDRLFPSQQVFPFLKRWKNSLPNTELIFDPNGEHDFSYWAEKYGGKIRDLLK